MIAFVAPVSAKAFTVLARAAALAFAENLMTPYLKLDPDLEEFNALGYRADGTAPLELDTFLEASISNRLGGSGIVYGTVYCFPEQGDTF